MTSYKQERPYWCTNSNCGFVFRIQDAACTGKLNEPVPNGLDLNTHRLCMRDQETEMEVAQLYWKKSDAANLKELCQAMLS